MAFESPSACARCSRARKRLKSAKWECAQNNQQLMLKEGIVFRQFCSLLADRLLEKDVHHDLQALEVPRLDPEIHGALLLAKIAQIEIACRCRHVQERI